MIIGIDLDNVIAGLVESLIIFHNDTYGTSLKQEDVKEWYLYKTWGGNLEEDDKKFKAYYKSSYFPKVKPIEGAKEAIEILSKEHKLHVVSARPKNVYKKTFEWIEKHFPNKFESINLTNYGDLKGKHQKKSEICKQLKSDIFIEDNLDFAMDVANSGIKTFLFDTNWNKSKSIHPNITRVYNWQEILDNIRKLK